MKHPAMVLFFGVMIAPACDPGDGRTGTGSSASGGAVDDACASGLRWNRGDAESPSMHPGRDCIACHEERGEAEKVRIAGTVYEALAEPDDCFGVEDVVIELTSVDGTVLRMTSNATGNFSREHSIATPYTAKVIADGRERVMTTPQTNLSCNSCHGETGLDNAPGRIMLP